MLSAHVILMGLRGSGKSTVGRLVARRLGVAFVDLDDRTPGELGSKTVAEAWGQHGEAAFREAEVRALNRVLSETGRVVALGGGTPTAPGGADQLRAAVAARCSLVYLRGTPASLAARLSQARNSHRPSLTGHAANSIEEVTAVFDARDPLYRSLATQTIEIDRLSAEKTVRAVLALVKG